MTESYTIDRLIARTGRVSAWLENPDHRLPVSCTIMVPEDSMEGEDGIEASFRFTSFALRNGAGVAMHLSNLRPEGSTSEHGLVASGPWSFAKIYSALNETLRRGGVYKAGAVVIHLDAEHPDSIKMITAPRTDSPWVKRCINLDEESWAAATPEWKAALLKSIAAGDVWLAKKKYTKDGRRVRFNVCLEVALDSRGSCLLEHVNLGMCEIDEIAPAFVYGMKQLCELHPLTGVGKSGEYLPPVIDKQVGLGMLGMANLLANEGVSYEQITEALEWINDLQEMPDREQILEPRRLALDPTAHKIAVELQAGISQASAVAHEHGMERAFAIAPTATCSYKHRDRMGFTTTPEIAPPIDRQVDRDSGTFGVQTVDYGNVQIAIEVGWDVYFRFCNAICTMLERTGLFHGYSFNSWSDVVTYDEAFIDCWMASNLTSMYYSLQVTPKTQAKDDILGALDDEFKGAYDFTAIEEEECLPCKIAAEAEGSECLACGE